jgi:purine-nucleoside phosphorylase
VTPAAAVVLGSGLGPALDGMTVEAEIQYPSIPGFPRISVPGHAGRLALGSFAGVPVAAFRGRVHYYEGHPMATVTLPTRLAAELGARVLVATAAVGSLDPMLEEGTLVVGSDHLNFLGENPLRGWRDERGWPAFVDIANAYDASLAERALVAAEEVGLPATRGVYAAVAGPSFETRAEMEFLRASGATVVGMSVVPEVVAARALGLRCVGMFCVTNRVGEGVSHEEVMAVGARVAEPLGRVLERVLSEI